jgi:hypothetical protein
LKEILNNKESGKGRIMLTGSPNRALDETNADDSIEPELEE